MKAVSCVALAVVMITVGSLHFLFPAPFVKIIPSQWPAPLALVYLSGLFEVAGGGGLLVPALRRWAAWGLMALYVAVFPANVNMALREIQPEGWSIPVWALWLRLPLQAVFIAWAYSFTRPEGRSNLRASS